MPSTTQLIATADITISGSALPRFDSVYLNQPFESHHTFEITLSPDMLPDRPGIVRLDQLINQYVGEPITIKFKQGLLAMGVVSGQQTQTFNGVVTSVRLTRLQSNTTLIVISGNSPTIRLNAGPTTRCFVDMSLKDIVTKVLNGLGSIKQSVSPNLSGPIPYVTQYEEDNFHFLQRLAEKYGEWIFYDGSQLVFGKGGRASSPTLQLTQGSNLFDMEYGVRVTPLNFKASYYNYETDIGSSYAAKSESVNGLQGMARIGYDKSETVFKDDLNVFSMHESGPDLLLSVMVRKSRQANKLAVLQGSTPEMELKVGGLVKVNDEIYATTNARQGATLQDTIDYGSFVVTRLSHFLDSRGVYRATFEAVPHDEDFPPVDYHIIPPVARPQIGRVKKVDDEGALGRVKVQLYWQIDDGSTTPWIRVMNPMSSKEHGVYFVPEIKEMVFVDFEHGDPDLPFVIGSTYKKDDEPGPLFNKDNNIKGIITRGGNHILINDETSKESIRIYNKDKKNIIELSLDGDTTISIKSEGSINLEAKDKITMKAKTIEFTADQEWKVKAGKTEISNDQGMKISANAKVEIAGQGGVKVEGSTVAIEAQATASVKANAQLDLESSGQAVLKGAIVMIN